jgi:hypothetical protein
MSLPALVSADDTDVPQAGERRSTDLFEAADGSGNVYRSRGPATVSVVYPLTVLDSRALRQTLVVRVEHDDDEGFVMSHGKLRIWGGGNTVFEAFKDFEATFLALRQSYESTPPQEMTPDAEAYLQELRSYLA